MAARLRRTFQYPSESDDEDAVEAGMDEQDQETLISNLSTKDTSSTRSYTALLLVLPLAPILLYTPRLFAASTLLPSLAAILSLLASAYTLYFLPLPPIQVTIFDASDLKGKRGAAGKAISRDAQGRKAEEAERKPVPYLSEEAVELVARYIVPVNAALCAALALMEVWQGREWSEGVTIGGGYVPGVIMMVVMFARRELRTVDLGELEKLRYRSKGS
ncbi:hypothetical protein BS50DRAFT_576634 [Corynespora cassiicola Philippines]|uniref:Uncharacterized protein n=1 Tax=Corynespora cassiicola Philippines TaxID=1448308 RepID=A0A2T2NG48_CORCC|nr:hypothetical protein BS50DRAFT_576634 [Corynespora cassiicola Philippines]